MTTRRTLLIFVITIIHILSGCAKSPDRPPAITGKQLIVTLQVRGQIKPIDDINPSVRRYYFIAIDNDNNPDTGPWAAVYPPYGGTGWVTSANAANSVGLTSFFRLDAESPNGYIYNVLPGSYFLNTTSPVPPIRTEIIDGGSTLRVTIDFSQIDTLAIPASDIKQLDINLITTNALPVGNQVIFNREWDALGPSGQNYVTIDTTRDQIIYGDNSDGHSVTDPDLDIVYWSIEVQTISSR